MTTMTDDQIRELLATVRLEEFIDVTPAMAAAAVKEMPGSYDICRTGIRREAPGDILYAMLKARSDELGLPEAASSVTPEMIAAGVGELSVWNDDYESKEEAVVRIFEAMEQARPTESSQPPAVVTAEMLAAGRLAFHNFYYGFTGRDDLGDAIEEQFVTLILEAAFAACREMPSARPSVG